MIAGCSAGVDQSKSDETQFTAVTAATTARAIYDAATSPKLAGTVVTKQELFNKVGSLTFEQYYNYLASKASNEAVAIDSTVFIDSLTQLRESGEAIKGMGIDYSSLMSYWNHIGVKPANISQAMFTDSLQTLSAYIDNSGIFAQLQAAINSGSSNLCPNIKAALVQTSLADAISGSAALSGSLTGTVSSDAAAAASGGTAQLLNAYSALNCSSLGNNSTASSNGNGTTASGSPIAGSQASETPSASQEKSSGSN